MKKRILIGMMALMVIAVTGCGKKDEAVQKQESVPEKEVKEEVTEVVQGSTDSDEVTAGVYPNGGDVVNVPLGTYFDGEQKNYCVIKMPADYIFGAIYTEDGVTDISNEEISGMNLSEASEKGLESQPYASRWVHILSAKEDGTELFFNIVTSDFMTLESEKEYAPEAVGLGTQDHPAIYYEDKDEYVTADLTFSYEINENILLSITYEGPLADEIGLDQLAQNLYDLVEVIE